MKLQWENTKQTALSACSCPALPNVHKSKKANILHPLAAHNSKNQWHEKKQWYDELAAGEHQHLPGQHLAQHSGCAAAAASRKPRITSQRAVKKRASTDNFNFKILWSIFESKALILFFNTAYIPLKSFHVFMTQILRKTEKCSNAQCCHRVLLKINTIAAI